MALAILGIFSVVINLNQKLYPSIDINYIDIDSIKCSYDFIVIGAGSAGSIVASRLSTHLSHPNVLLIEAGSKAETSIMSEQITPALFQLNPLTEIDWKYQTMPQKYYGYDSWCNSIYNNECYQTIIWK